MQDVLEEFHRLEDQIAGKSHRAVLVHEASIGVETSDGPIDRVMAKRREVQKRRRQEAARRRISVTPPIVHIEHPPTGTCNILLSSDM